MLPSDEGNLDKKKLHCLYKNTRNNHDYLTNTSIDSVSTRYGSLISSPKSTTINNKYRKNSDSIY